MCKLLKEHTDSFLQSSALLSQFDGMNVAERRLITEHFTVDRSHHELLHLPLKGEVNTSIISGITGPICTIWFLMQDRIGKLGESYHGGVGGGHLFFDGC